MFDGSSQNALHLNWFCIFKGVLLATAVGV